MKHLMVFPLIVCLAIFFCAVGTAQDGALVLRFSFDSQTAHDLSGAGNDGTVASSSYGLSSGSILEYGVVLVSNIYKLVS